MYGLTLEELHEYFNIPTLLLTQPLMIDCECTPEDMLEIYGLVVKDYVASGLCIKPHPRDEFPYEECFAGVKVMRTKIPLQILVYMGYSPLRAITINSSAVSEFEKTKTQIIYLGTDIHPKIHEKWGK